MNDITIVVHGDPVPQHRPRFVRTGKFVRTYNVKEDNTYREKLYWEAKKQVKRPISREIPLLVELNVYRRLTSALARKAEEAEMGLIQPNTRPDIDNYIKQVFDALNGIVWEDDGQIVKVVAAKWYSATPRIEIRVHSLGSTKQ
jgi:Holliday junction resolvase RusA-like endonuclease